MPVLVLATEAAEAVSARNGLALDELLNYAGGTLHLATVPSLPPFRSVGRSVMLKWHQIGIRFVPATELDGPLGGPGPAQAAAAERELGRAAQVWKQDGDLDGELEELGID